MHRRPQITEPGAYRLPVNEIIQGDCIQVLKTFPEKSVD